MRDPGYRPASRSPNPRTSARTATLPHSMRPLSVCALRPSPPPREGRETTGMRGCARVDVETRQAPRLQAPGAVRIFSHFSEGGGAVGARPLLGPEAGGGEEPGWGKGNLGVFCARQG